MDDKKLALTLNNGETDFYKQISDLLALARQFAKKQLDSTIVAAYYEIGRMIVEREQQGQKRAQYGAKLIKGLSDYLTGQYGRGFSVVNLKSIRKFYQVYSPSIGQSLTALSEKNEKGKVLINVFDTNTQKGQSLMYVNYFARYVRQEFEKPTIGILLCSQKNDNIVELTLPKDANIYASEYSLYLPDKALLQSKLAEWVEEFEDSHGTNKA
jgi:hypothetical protein